MIFSDIYSHNSINLRELLSTVTALRNLAAQEHNYFCYSYDLHKRNKTIHEMCVSIYSYVYLCYCDLQFYYDLQNLASFLPPCWRRKHRIAFLTIGISLKS